MENEYGITVTNKYSLFLSGDEDLLQVLQRELESKPASKKEKQKKTSGKEKEIKPSQSTVSGNEQQKVESVDQFTSPTSGEGMYDGRYYIHNVVNIIVCVAFYTTFCYIRYTEHQFEA